MSRIEVRDENRVVNPGELTGDRFGELAQGWLAVECARHKVCRIESQQICFFCPRGIILEMSMRGIVPIAAGVNDEISATEFVCVSLSK